MRVQPWQSDCIVEQAAEFIRKKLARRSTGLAPIGQSRGLLRLRAPQTFLRIIFSIPLLSLVRTDQITAQGLHCEGLFQKALFSMLSLFYTRSPHAPHFQNRKKEIPSWLLLLIKKQQGKKVKRGPKWFAFFLTLSCGKVRSWILHFSRSLSSKSLFLKSPNNVKPLKPEASHISVLPGVQQITAEYSSPGRGSQAFPETCCLVTPTRLTPPTATCHCGYSWAAGRLWLEDNHTI